MNRRSNSTSDSVTHENEDDPTKVDQVHGRRINLELSGIWDMEFYTENPDTHVQNGILSDLEVLAIKRFKNGFGIGFVESWIQQVTDDDGIPAALNGFVGRAFEIGPIVTYSTKLGKSDLDFNARWIHDFDVSKRVEGDGFNFTASLKF
jgi:hypothetical protein